MPRSRKKTPVEPFGPEWDEALNFFRLLLRLESKQVRQQVSKLMLALDREALEVFRTGRYIEVLAPPRNLRLLTQRYGRAGITAHLRSKFAGDLLDLADLEDLDVRLKRQALHWYQQGAALLDCVERVRAYTAIYEHMLRKQRPHPRGRAPSVAHAYLANQQTRLGLSDDEVTRRLVQAGLVNGREAYVVQFKENIIKKHRLRYRQRRTSVLGQNASP